MDYGAMGAMGPLGALGALGALDANWVCFGYTLSMLWIYFRETCLVACTFVSCRLYQPKMV